MSLVLGIYDVFAYAIPGSLYFAWLAYVSDRLGWFSRICSGLGNGSQGHALGRRNATAAVYCERIKAQSRG
jgi:hypothetical protein